ncbi:MAG: TRAP transporter large permease subunit, partial [Gammaproteobacteria bacterium]|nr:TRAP transporter large permease subunit [Gammaproteobacteria bacterium]
MLIPALLFLTVVLVLLAGFPVAFSLAGTALAFAAVGSLTGHFDASFLSIMPSRIYGGVMTSEILVAVPLFVFMGVMLERARIAESLLDTLGMLFGSLRGGLGIGVMLVGVLLAASTGIVGATVVTMGLLSLPTMLKRGYDPAAACGAICASGTLGQIIPPSIVLVLLGDVLSSAYTQAQINMGVFSPRTVSVGDLFVGALLPGLMLVAMYCIYLLVLAAVRPATMPAYTIDEGDPITGRRLAGRVVKVMLPPVILIVAVLGS